jgi:hypothetical protein
MEEERILMSQRQLQRWHVMGLVEGGKGYEYPPNMNSKIVIVGFRIKPYRASIAIRKEVGPW